MSKLHQHSLAMGLVEPEYEVSQEGMIGDMSNWVRDLFKYKPDDHNKLMGKALNSGQSSIDSSRKLRKLLQKCFADDRWLSHQEFYEGEVVSNFATDVLHFGNHDMGNPIRSVLMYSEEVIGNMQVVTNAGAAQSAFLRTKYDDLLHDCRYQLESVRVEYAKRREAATTGTKKSASSDFFSTLLGDILPNVLIMPKVERLVKELEDGAQNDRLSAARFWNTSPRYSLFKHSVETGPYKGREVKVLPGGDIKNTLPALTPMQIKELARLVLDWLDRGLLHSPVGVFQALVAQKVGIDKMLWGIYPTAWDPDDDWDTNPDDEQLLWFVIESSREGRKLEDILSQSRFNKDWVNNSALFGTLELAAVGILHWIGASIKGRIPSQAP